MKNNKIPSVYPATGTQILKTLGISIKQYKKDIKKYILERKNDKR